MIPVPSFFVIIIDVNMKALLLLKIINILANVFILSDTSLFMFHFRRDNYWNLDFANEFINMTFRDVK